MTGGVVAVNRDIDMPSGIRVTRPTTVNSRCIEGPVTSLIG